MESLVAVICLFHLSLVCLFFDNPPLYPPDFVAEVDTDLIEGSAVGGKGDSIAFLIDLADGFFGSTVQLELHDVDVVVGLHYHVYAAVGRAVFRLSVEAQQLEDDEEHVLVVPFQVACQLVGCVGKEALEAAHEGVGVAASDFPDEAAYLERGVARRKRRIVGQQKLGETFFYFLVGEAQFIGPEFFVEPLDGEVATLVEDGDGIGLHRVDTAQ